MIYNNIYVNLENLNQVEEYIKTLKFYKFNCFHKIPYTIFISCEYSRTSELFKLDDDLKVIFKEENI